MNILGHKFVLISHTLTCYIYIIHIVLRKKVVSFLYQQVKAISNDHAF